MCGSHNDACLHRDRRASKPIGKSASSKPKHSSASRSCQVLLRPAARSEAVFGPASYPDERRAGRCTTPPRRNRVLWPVEGSASRWATDPTGRALWSLTALDGDPGVLLGAVLTRPGWNSGAPIRPRRCRETHGSAGRARESSSRSGPQRPLSPAPKSHPPRIHPRQARVGLSAHSPV